jgi:hypothetical protein
LPVCQQPSGAASTSYFILKSNRIQHIEAAIRDGCWATTQKNEAKLNKAFRESARVLLFFSANGGGAFQGCATMTSAIDPKRKTYWVQEGRSEAEADFEGAPFTIKWHVVANVSFEKTKHLINPLNKNLPLKCLRDGQRVDPVVALKLLELFGATQVSHVAKPSKRCGRVAKVGTTRVQRSTLVPAVLAPVVCGLSLPPAPRAAQKAVCSAPTPKLIRAAPSQPTEAPKPFLSERKVLTARVGGYQSPTQSQSFSSRGFPTGILQPIRVDSCNSTTAHEGLALKVCSPSILVHRTYLNSLQP